MNHTKKGRTRRRKMQIPNDLLILLMMYVSTYKLYFRLRKQTERREEMVRGLYERYMVL